MELGAAAWNWTGCCVCWMVTLPPAIGFINVRVEVGLPKPKVVGTTSGRWTFGELVDAVVEVDASGRLGWLAAAGGARLAMSATMPRRHVGVVCA